MQELRISHTKNTPEIILNPDGLLKFSGRSIHENIFDFFIPVDRWIDEYLKSPADVTCIDINLEYINSASSKLLINLIQRVSRVKLMHKKIVVNWYYEDGDEDILERGEYFSSMLNLRFNFVKVT